MSKICAEDIRGRLYRSYGIKSNHSDDHLEWLIGYAVKRYKDTERAFDEVDRWLRYKQ